MKNWDELEVSFNVEKIPQIIPVNMRMAYEIAKKPGVSIRAGKRLIVLRDGLKKWVETEAQKDKSL